MNVLYHINAALVGDSLSKADTNDYKGVAKSLTQYLGHGKDTDILWLTQPAWIDRYYTYLTEEYRSNKRRNDEPNPEECHTTALRYLKQLRKLVNRATAAGIFPDIDIFSGTAVADRLARRKGVTVTPVTAQLRDIVFTHDAALARAVEPYLISLYLCGATPAQIAEMHDTQFDAERRAVYLPHLRVEVTYTESVFESIRSYVRRSSGTPYDITVLQQTLADRGLTLCASADPFTDWINLAVESGTLADPRRIVAIRLCGKYIPNATDTAGIQATVRVMCHSYNRHKKSWYVLRTVGDTGSAVAKRLTGGTSREPGIFSQRPHDIYVPHVQPAQPRGRAKRPKIVDPSSVLRNVVFFNAELSEAERLDRTLAGAYVMSRNTPRGREYETVPYREIYTLQLVLRSISSAQAQEALSSEELRDTLGAQTFEKGEVVSVAVPGFEEYTARVTAVRRDSTYDLTVTSGPFKVDLKSIPLGLIRRLS